MKHYGTKKLETNRLVLRRFDVTDAQAMYRNWASDPEVTTYLTWPAHKSPEVSRAVLESWIPLYQNKDYYQWAITLRESPGEPVGSIAAVRVDDDLSLVHIGYCLGKNWWHRGLMSEALAAVISFFFDQVGVNRVECRHDPRNPRSGMVMKACGMRYEGTARSADRNNQGVCDACLYGLLRSDRVSLSDQKDACTSHSAAETQITV